jgi:hypothetical protein
VLQWIVQVLPILAATLIAIMTYSLSKSIRYIGRGVLRDIGWALDRTPALDAFLMFVLQAVLVTSTVTALFHHVSNHIIQSLDILYLASLLLLVMYHTRKEAYVLPA